ncbi:Gfo/Idh/MocA family protein [Kutzneria buriramensis]|uniref:Gfo/Idh/MocA family protein n=1 Tax=Kutzneria buriramensis TaxID=1045776 RepID=UPI001B87DD25|nr:Gfo/Idh/MocA family oxidoreductase [Kutzneria buriramensis]
MSGFAIVGTGWRAEYFWRLAAELDGLDCTGVVSRSKDGLPVPVYRTLDECLATKPDFVVTATPWAVTPSLVAELAERGVPVLAETPPAPDLLGLRELWAKVGPGKAQVAEQYSRMPAHAARVALVHKGVLGEPKRVDVSSTHQYHAVSLIRTLLGVGRGRADVRAVRTIARLADPLSRDGWAEPAEIKDATTTIATIEFDGGGLGLYDFTDNQWHNQLLMRRLLVRGTLGELRDNEVVRLTAPKTIVRTEIVRRQTGYDLDLDGYDTDHITFGDEVLYRNPYQGKRWNDEEIAIATLLQDMGNWVRGDGPEPYPLADGIQDHRIALAIEEAADSGLPVRVDDEPWH